MGYDTKFVGSISIEPSLSKTLIKTINDFCDERHEWTGAPDLYCRFKIREDGSCIEWNGNPRTYQAEEWIEYLINTFIAPAGHNCNGQFNAQGENLDDIWKIIVEDNKVDSHHDSSEEALSKIADDIQRQDDKFHEVLCDITEVEEVIDSYIETIKPFAEKGITIPADKAIAFATSVKNMLKELVEC